MNDQQRSLSPIEVGAIIERATAAWDARWERSKQRWAQDEVDRNRRLFARALLASGEAHVERDELLRCWHVRAHGTYSWIGDADVRAELIGAPI